MEKRGKGRKAGTHYSTSKSPKKNNNSKKKGEVGMEEGEDDRE